mmetsp:Transcript_816/g.1813  ORF Transcript_816/g.1813 Transcript_816/m.1813 type:complete len:317 (-) Transcript_816:1085-2035(-)
MRADMTADHVVGQAFVLDGVRFVPEDAQHVEAAKNRIRETDILRECLLRVVPALHRVGHSNDGASRMQCGHDASLRNRDGLLLHGLMDGRPVLVVHLVELVDEADAIVCQDHSTALEGPLAVLVPRERRCETHGAGTLARGVDGFREGLFYVLQELRLGKARIANDERVDVTADSVLSRRKLPLTTHHAQRNRCLDVGHAVDRWRYRRDEALTNVGILRQVQNLLLLLVGDLAFLDIALTAHVHRLDLGSVDWETGARIGRRVVQATIHACQVHFVSWAHGIRLGTRQDHLLRTRHLAWFDFAGAFLQVDLLVIPV